MDVDEPHVDSVSEEIILATYRKDAVTVAECLKRCTPETTAEMSLSRAAAVQLLGEDVYLGSHSWSTQEGFPVMYFAGANPGFRRRAVHAPAPPSRGAGRETCRVFVFSRERNRLLPSHRASNRWSRPLSRPDETYRAGSYPNEHATVAPTTRYPEDGPSRRCDTPSRAPPRGPAPRPPREKTPHMVFSRGSWNPAWTRYFATSKFRGRSSLRSPTPRRRGVGRRPAAAPALFLPSRPLPLIAYRRLSLRLPLPLFSEMGRRGCDSRVVGGCAPRLRRARRSECSRFTWRRRRATWTWRACWWRTARLAAPPTARDGARSTTPRTTDGPRGAVPSTASWRCSNSWRSAARTSTPPTARDTRARTAPRSPARRKSSVSFVVSARDRTRRRFAG